jgi:hypothetical protein
MTGGRNAVDYRIQKWYNALVRTIREDERYLACPKIVRSRSINGRPKS